uniref:Uncharacterized protein n=1 Tax=Pseudodiaptomus poplesia TaxID=213370 RepID=A0A0U2V6Z0_9MAXI|nr:hypothetical protein [Pseudodiaptomus poplesia]
MGIQTLTYALVLSLAILPSIHAQWKSLEEELQSLSERGASPITDEGRDAYIVNSDSRPDGSPFQEGGDERPEIRGAAPILRPTGPSCPECDFSKYTKCGCIPMLSKDGRGNCNYHDGSKKDLRVWCYISTTKGEDPTKVCPDAMKSSEFPGMYWSRIACITP